MLLVTFSVLLLSQVIAAPPPGLLLPLRVLLMTVTELLDSTNMPPPLLPLTVERISVSVLLSVRTAPLGPAIPPVIVRS